MGASVTRQMNSEQVARSQEELSRLQCIQESKQEIGMLYHALAQAEQQPYLKSLQGSGKVDSDPKPSEFMDSQDTRGWILISAQSRVRNNPHVLEVSLHNRYDSLGLKKGRGCQ